MTWLLIALFWVFCGVLIEAFLAVYDWLNHPRFRCSSGDISEESGYEEDSQGRLICPAQDDECSNSPLPHSMSTSGTRFGGI